MGSLLLPEAAMVKSWAWSPISSLLACWSVPCSLQLALSGPFSCSSCISGNCYRTALEYSSHLKVQCWEICSAKGVMLLQAYIETAASRQESEPSPILQGLGCPLTHLQKQRIEGENPGKDKPQARGWSSLWSQAVSLTFPGLAKGAVEGGSLQRPCESSGSTGDIKATTCPIYEKKNPTHRVQRYFTQTQWVHKHALLVLTRTPWHTWLTQFCLLYFIRLDDLIKCRTKS